MRSRSSSPTKTSCTASSSHEQGLRPSRRQETSRQARTGSPFRVLDRFRHRNFTRMGNSPPNKAPLHPPGRDPLRFQPHAPKLPHDQHASHFSFEEPQPTDRHFLPKARHLRVVQQPADHFADAAAENVPGAPGRHDLVPVFVRQCRARGSVSRGGVEPGHGRWAGFAAHQGLGAS